MTSFGKGLHNKVSLSILHPSSIILRDFKSTLSHSAVTLQLQWNCNREIFPLTSAKCVPNQLSVAEEESQKRQQYGVIQGLLRESNCLREELHNLSCLTQIKAEERGQKHRELLRVEVQYQLTQTHTTHTRAQVHSELIPVSSFVLSWTYADVAVHFSHTNVSSTSKRS